MMNNEEADRMVKYLVLGLLQEWYMAGKTQTTLAEIYEVLGAKDDGETSELDDTILTIGEEILTLDVDHLNAVLGNRIH